MPAPCKHIWMPTCSVYLMLSGPRPIHFHFTFVFLFLSVTFCWNHTCYLTGNIWSPVVWLWVEYGTANIFDACYNLYPSFLSVNIFVQVRKMYSFTSHVAYKFWAHTKYKWPLRIGKNVKREEKNICCTPAEINIEFQYFSQPWVTFTVR